MTSKTSSFEGRQETCTSLTAVLSSVEEMKSADLFRSNPTEAKAASCNAVCNETSSQGIERQSTSRGSEKEVEFDASQDQLGGLPAPEAAGFSVGSNISLRIPNEPARSTNFSLSRITSDCTVSDSSSFRPPPLSIVIPSTKFPENFGNICFTLGRAKQDETSEISSAVPFRTSVPKLIPPYQLQGAPRITSSKDRRYRLHVGSARRAVNAQDPSCSQGQSEKFPLGTSESISTQLSIPLCPDVQPAPVIVSPNRLTTPQNATSVSLPLKKVPYTQLPLITQLASLPFPVTNSTKSESSRPKAARVFPIITGKMPDIMPITTASLQSGTAIPAVQKETPANKKKDSDHSQLDYNSMESNEESYYYYSDSSSEDSNDVHSTHASSTTVIDLDVRHNNHLTEDSAIYKDAQAFKHIPTGNVRNDRQNTSITPVYIPPTLPLTGDSIVSPLVYSDKAPYSTDFQRLRPAPFLPQTPSSDSNISLVTAPLGQDSKDLCSLSRTSLSQNSATATTEFRVNVKTPRTCDTGNPSLQQSVRHALSNSSILRNPNLQSTLRQNKSVDFDGKHLSKLGHIVITADCLESRHVRLSQVETQRSTSSMSEDDANIASGELFSESRYNNRQSTTSAGFEAAEKRAKGQTTVSTKDRVSFSGRDTIVEFPHTEGESHSIIICQNDGSANLTCTHPSGDFISDGSACSLYKQGHLSASAKDVVSCSTHEETTPTVKNSLTSNRSQGGNILPNNAHKLQNNLSQNKLESSAKHHSVDDVSLPARKNTAACGKEEKQSGDLHATNAFRPKSRAQSKTPYFTSKHETSANSVEMADFLGLEFVASEDTQYANKALRSNRSFVRALEMVPQSNRHSQSTTDCHSGEITVTAPSETK
ncbi:Kinase [Giardia lamblia P15]|uniref:Kinase n=1 Tax=Giardia intestinalis (strain P15) TaxID=658858 RepID=E1F1M3_GIAIA|nr:Kinase [Giardia lamblia P15]